MILGKVIRSRFLLVIPLHGIMSSEWFSWPLPASLDVCKRKKKGRSGIETRKMAGDVLCFCRKKEQIMKAYPVLLDADWASESILKDEEALCLDATFYGNVARFINHRCEDATLVEVPVQVKTPDRHYYHVAFFTTREVKAFEELTWDYGIDFDDRNHPVKAFECSCGSELCRDKKRRGGSARPRKTAARWRR
ncbi:hypothetical protein Droror1_Dr00008091 [Drosera rotundifolia]